MVKYIWILLYTRIARSKYSALLCFFSSDRSTFRPVLVSPRFRPVHCTFRWLIWKITSKLLRYSSRSSRESRFYDFTSSLTLWSIHFSWHTTTPRECPNFHIFFIATMSQFHPIAKKLHWRKRKRAAFHVGFHSISAISKTHLLKWFFSP